MRDIKGANGFVVARVDSSGMVTLGPDPGPIVGRVSSTGDVFGDDAGVQQLGRVDGEGNIIDAQRDILGKVDAWGRVHDRSGGARRDRRSAGRRRRVDAHRATGQRSQFGLSSGG